MAGERTVQGEGKIESADQVQEGKKLRERILEMFSRTQGIRAEYRAFRITFLLYEDQALGYALDGEMVTRFYCAATTRDGRRIDSRTAGLEKVTQETAGDESTLCLRYVENGLALVQELCVRKGEPCFVARVTLCAMDGGSVATNYLAPLDYAYPNAACRPLFLSLEQRMLLVPYDNDMWVRYESAPLRPGRTSYDVTAIYDPGTGEGLVIGALDHETWKNAIRCVSSDARCYTAYSGAADAGTHDICPHGYLEGHKVSSARFVCGWYEDIRDGLEAFGRRAMEQKTAVTWHSGTPFGWNSYSAGCMTLEEWETAGEYLKKELPSFADAQGVTYINLDANFLLDEGRMRQIVKTLHANGQKAGNYLAPLAVFGALSELEPLRDTDGNCIPYEEIMMKDAQGRPYPPIDGSRPVDITHPVAERQLRSHLRWLVDMGFDYIKLDFLSHGALEGKRHDPSVRTGRQALTRFYQILAQELSREKTGRDIFVSLSIAPLFPGGYAHARRCCCDAFGHQEDVRYVLNALTYGWWQSGTLYCYNDPDHTVLMRSMVDQRGETDEVCARSRYHASVISGTVLLLSDDFGPFSDKEEIEKTRSRVRSIADNPLLNEVARIGKAFRPLHMGEDASSVYILREGGRSFIALFNLQEEYQELSVLPGEAGLPETGTLRNLEDGLTTAYTGLITAKLGACASVIYEVAPASQ